TGIERAVFDGLDKDQQETWAIHGVFPTFDWTPDCKKIVITAGGKLWSIDITSGNRTAIPFTAHIKQTVTNALHYPQKLAEQNVDIKMIRWPIASPDGRELIFVAAGHLYKMQLPSGKPKRLTTASELEYSPSFSADGKWLTYVTWNDDEGGHIWRLKLSGGSPEKLTKMPNQYANPAFSPDGTKIVFLQGSGSTNRGDDLGGENFLPIYLLDLTNSKTSYITNTANRGPNRRMPRLSFDAKGERVIFFESKDGQTMLSSIKLDGTDYRQHIANKTAEEIIPSPDGKWVAFKELHNAYVAPLPVAGAKALTVSANDTAVPVKKLTKIAGEWLNWTSDSKTVTWSFGPTFYRQTLEKIYAEPSSESKENKENKENKEETNKLGANLAIEAESFPIELTMPRYTPKGVVVLTSARIITMNGDQVIENGNIVIEDNRIKAVGASVSIPTGAKVVDLAGKTIMPGIVDVHAHMHYSNLDITPNREWAYYTNLAYGVTTT
ncbi:MAG: amidohydrolase, partial [bacterium]